MLLSVSAQRDTTQGFGGVGIHVFTQLRRP